MNAAYFLRPKGRVTYLYEDFTVRQGLEKMRRSGFAAVPVIARDGTYLGIVSEGDFLWRLVDSESLRVLPSRNLEKLSVRDLIREDAYPPVSITVSMEELLDAAMDQNFVPVVDDIAHFVGIVTRRDIIRYFAGGNGEDRKIV